MQDNIEGEEAKWLPFYQEFYFQEYLSDETLSIKLQSKTTAGKKKLNFMACGTKKGSLFLGK